MTTAFFILSWLVGMKENPSNRQKYKTDSIFGWSITWKERQSEYKSTEVFWH